MNSKKAKTLGLRSAQKIHDAGTVMTPTWQEERGIVFRRMHVTEVATQTLVAMVMDKRANVLGSLDERSLRVVGNELNRRMKSDPELQ